jgi:hypothetical protein
MILNVFSLQHERWYLEMNPRGEVPVLKHGDQIIIDSNGECRVARWFIFIPKIPI